MTIQIGNAPCSRGVEFADDPRNPDWRTVLKENAEAGYRGIIHAHAAGFMDFEPELERLLDVVDEKVLKICFDTGFDGWCMVEQDCDPTGDTSPVDGAKTNRAYLQSIGFQVV